MIFGSLRGRQARRDAQLLLVVLFFVWWPGAHFDFFEYLHAHARQLEAIEFDEFLIALIVLLVGLFWFAPSWRPEMGGVEPAEAIRDINAAMPIIFAAGYDRDEALPQEKVPDNAVVIHKPFPFETFGYMLSRFMKQAN